MSIGKLMGQAKVTLSAREALKKYRPSQLQIWIGKQARGLAERLLRDWWDR